MAPHCGHSPAPGSAVRCHSFSALLICWSTRMTDLPHDPVTEYIEVELVLRHLDLGRKHQSVEGVEHQARGEQVCGNGLHVARRAQLRAANVRWMLVRRLSYLRMKGSKCRR